MNNVLEMLPVKAVYTRNLETTDAIEAEIKTQEAELKERELGIMANRHIGARTLANDEARKARAIREKIKTLRERKTRMQQAFDPAI
jgi:hypothetical protein